MGTPQPTLAVSLRPGRLGGAGGGANSAQLLALARGEPAPALQALALRLEILSQAEADARLQQVGPNAIAREKRQSP